MVWKLERQFGRASQLHASSESAAADPDASRAIRLMQVTAPALVLGSAQPEQHVNRGEAERAGIEVARRRSGGGAVLVTDSGVVWVDVILPAGDPLWDPDVSKAPLWVGQAWADSLTRLGIGPATVWKDRMLTNEWSSRVCFAGVAPGEVLVGGKKAIGVSQRRTRYAALFQTAVLLEWAPADLLRLLALDPESRRRAEDELKSAVVTVAASPADLVDAFVSSLPE